jgi:micrococcal nuclease
MLFKRISIFFVLFVLSSALAKNSARVVSVVDGDTLVILLNGQEEKIRFIGIDTPESKKNTKALKDAERSGLDVSIIVSQGKRATAFVQGIIKKDDVVILELDVQERDKYGRLLAYVFLNDGRFLNEIIVKSGYASVLTIPPNVKYINRFIDAYKYARENKLGLWADK